MVKKDLGLKEADVSAVDATKQKSLNLALYEPEIECQTSSMLSGKHSEVVQFDALPDIEVIKAWLADDDLQYLRICSTNIGFVRTFQKRLKRDPK